MLLLHAVMAVHPVGAGLAQRELITERASRWNRVLGNEGDPIHAIGQQQAMPVHPRRHPQMVDHINLEAIGLLDGKAPTAGGIEGGENHDLLAQHLQRGGLNPQGHPCRASPGT